MLLLASRDLRYAALTVSFGMYRAGFIGLRLFFERLLGAVFFSANEMQLRLRLRGDIDQQWSTIIDEEQGIFSKKFADAFFAELREDTTQYRNMAKMTYRQCSEFVHGDPKIEPTLPGQLQFDESTLEKWGNLLDAAQMVVAFSLTLRHMADLSKADIQRVEESLTTISHIPAVRDRFPQ